MTDLDKFIQKVKEMRAAQVSYFRNPHPSPIIFLLTALLVSGCAEQNLSSLKPPIVVIAKDKYCAVLRDSAGVMLFATSGTTYGGAIINSYNLGDTLK